MLSPEITKLNYSYKKAGSDVWVLNYDDIPVDRPLIKDQQIVHLAPGSMGGNHKHPRIEWFIGIGDLILVWLDEDNKKHEESMNPNGQIKLIKVPAFLPHAVLNKSTNQTGILFEMADGKIKDIEIVKVI